jgi:RHS repeat-associated protein
VTTTTVTSPASTLPATSLSLAGLTLSSTDQHGCTTTYGYDALMRQISVESRSGPNNERLTGSYTHYNTAGQVDYTEDALGTRTVYGYEPGTGRNISTTQVPPPSSLLSPTFVQTAFDQAGRTVATWGATYPVAYEYDQAGRMIAMYTYRGTNAIASYSDIVALKTEMDRTQWLYDQATGLLTNKLYSDGKGPAYSYTALGQLSTRKWARFDSAGLPLLTQYKYDNFGSLTNTAYSDGTCSVSFFVNALGQMKTISDASGTRTLDYAADGRMLAETLAFSTSLFTLHEKFDNLGRNVGYALSNEISQITGTMQSFDLYGRLTQVAVDGIVNAFTYSYLEGSHLQKSLAMPNGVTRTFGYESNRDLLTSIIHSNATSRLVQRDFTFDGLGRLENRYLFQGREWDKHGGFYYFRNRIYLPERGEFASPDMNLGRGILGELDGMATLTFCGGDPVNCIDPTGLEIWVDAEWSKDAAGKYHVTKQAHYDRGLKKWMFRTTGVDIKPLETSIWAFNEYQTEFEKMIETTEGMGLYTFLDSHKDDLQITFRNEPGVRGQEIAKSVDKSGNMILGGIFFNPYLYRKDPLRPGYGTIAHEFQHKVETLGVLDFLEKKGRKPESEEYESISDKVLKVSNRNQKQNEGKVVLYENWFGEKERAILSTAKEATAVRAQNIVVMKYKSKHDEKQQPPITYYRGEGYIDNPLPSAYWTEEFRKYREDYRALRLSLKTF